MYFVSGRESYILSYRLNHILKPNIKDETVMRVQDITQEPISRGMDSAINRCLDELEELRKKLNGKPQVLTCNRMEELTNDK